MNDGRTDGKDSVRGRRRFARRWTQRLAAGIVIAVLLAAGATWLRFGSYGVNAVLREGGTFVRNGGTYWADVAADDPRISPSMRLALESQPAALPGELQWRSIAAGFEVAELQVIAGGTLVDSIMLARIDPALYRFAVRSAPAGDKNLDRWMSTLGAALVVNGSYYASDGTPDTPILSAGLLLGPSDYQARAGAFVASAGSVGIRDLAEESWQKAFRGASDAMVSYPLLIAADGSSRVKVHSRWLANRSFVGEDRTGRILVGTTSDAYFSLDELAAFLQRAPLNLRMALNLDGGPVACQGIALNGYARKTYGRWELQVRDGQPRLLPWPYGSAPMPVVLAVFSKG